MSGWLARSTGPARMAAFAVLVAACAVLAHQLHIVPVRARLNALRAEVRLRAGESAPSENARDAQEVEREIGRLRGRLSALYAGVSDRPNVGSLLNRLQASAEDAGVHLLSFSPASIPEGEEARSWSARVRLAGSYGALLALMSRLAEERDGAMESVTMEARGSAHVDGSLVADGTVTVPLRPAGEPALPFVEAGDGDVPATVLDLLRADRDPFAHPTPTAVSHPVERARPDGLAGVTAADATLKGTLDTPDGRIAFLLGADGRTYTVHTGDELFDGIVSAIQEQSLVVVPKSGGLPSMMTPGSVAVLGVAELR